MRKATLFVVVQLAFLVLAIPARADWLPVLSGPVVRVVAAGKHAAVLRNGEVLILREDGQVLSRLSEQAKAIATVGESKLKQVAEETLDRLEIPEIDRGTDYTDDLVDDESRLGQRRSWRAGARGASPQDSASSFALAAGSIEMWIGTARGIYRVGDEGQPVLAFGNKSHGPRLAAGGPWLLVDKGNALALLSAGNEAHTISISSPADAIAVSASGDRIAWAVGAEINSVGPAGRRRLVAFGPVVGLTFCGDTLIALLSDGLWAIPPEGRGEMRAAPPAARKLICVADAAVPWLAIGQGLWASSNQGQQWDALPAPNAALLDIAVSDHHIWLATRDGLFASVDATVTAELRTANGVPLRARAHKAPSWLGGLLPKVSLRAAATFQTGKHDIEGFAFAAFPLGPEATPATAHLSYETAPGPAVEVPSAAAVLPDGEGSCLAAARRKAIELAMAEPERARSYVSRAGHAAYLPELRLLVSRRYGRSESLDVDGSTAAASSPLGIDTVNDIRYEARATWDLARLVFSSEELAAQAQALHMAELRREIETTMNRLYFERRRLLALAPAQRSDVVAQKLRSQEVEAELDAMSAGAFGNCVSEKSVATR